MVSTASLVVPVSTPVNGLSQYQQRCEVSLSHALLDSHKTTFTEAAKEAKIEADLPQAVYHNELVVLQESWHVDLHAALLCMHFYQ